MDEAIVQLALQVGVPATMGIIIVWYLIKVIIPKQMETIDKQSAMFKDALLSQQASFDAALRLEQQVHREMLQSVTETIRAESVLTRETLTELNRSTQALVVAVNRMYGQLGLNGQSSDR